MSKFRKVLKKAFTPITIMLIPHSNNKPFSLKVPSAGVVLSVFLWVVGSVYVFSVAVKAFEYNHMKEKVDYYSGQFIEFKATVHALKKTEAEFRRIFSLGSKDKVLENVHTNDSGSLDIEALRGQIKNTVNTVGEIKEYLRLQKDIYMATPKGWPVEGRITSHYGKRESPVHGGDDFHSGIDIGADTGAPVRATAEGVVSFSGWNKGSGNLVVLEHGFGYSTFYAHNKNNAAAVGQRVKRGDIIGYVGSTGNATGPHSHYEVWKNEKPVNPVSLMKGRS
jgi:murein DD-endopeptidase MepM/ murein hydrolase activator NlpD